MLREDQDWMAYIDGEVRAICEQKGWKHQIRRSWSVRVRPDSDSPIDDYEWKLLPESDSNPADASPECYAGCYYVLRFEKAREKFVLQHSTSHVGVMGPNHEVETYSEIWPRNDIISKSLREANRRGETPRLEFPPAVGWLRDHLLELTSRFRANLFSVT